MKKFLTIALVALISVTAVFADVTFTGKAGIEFGYNLDTTAYGFKNSNSTSLTWMLETGKNGSAGEKDLRAVIEGKFTVKNASASASISKADIIYKDITVGILNSGSANYAKSYYDDNMDGKADVDKIQTVSTHKTGEMTAPTAVYTYNKATDTWGWKITPAKAVTAPMAGFTVSYKGYKVGFGTEGDVDDDKNTTWIFAETASIALAEGASVQAAGAALIEDGEATIMANAKAAYKNDAVSASVAADVKYADEAVAVEASAKVAVKPVTVDVFAQYANEKVILDAKAEYAFEAEEVSGAVYADVRDILNTASIDAAVGAEVALEPCTVGAEVEVVYGDEVTAVCPSAWVSSTSLIDNCTVQLTWTGADFKAEKSGKITTSATIKF